MNFLFISDIHSNINALKSVLDNSKEYDVSQIFCLGDITGYFPDFEEVIDLLIENKVCCLQGNHDAFLTGILPIDTRRGYYEAYLLTKNGISKRQSNWLKQQKIYLRKKIGDAEFGLFHGGPGNYLSQYLYPDQITKDHLNDTADFIVVGHTHLQFQFKVNDKVIINPGAVGLPRNGDYRAHAMLFNSEKKVFSELRCSYNLSDTLERYFLNPTVPDKLLHNLHFGRSSSRRLITSKHLFLNDDDLEVLNRLGINSLNTRWGAIFSPINHNFQKNVLYAACYNDGVVELTSNNLRFHWQCINSILDKELGIKRDNSGWFFSKKYDSVSDFKSKFAGELEEKFQIINNSDYD